MRVCDRCFKADAPLQKREVYPVTITVEMDSKWQSHGPMVYKWDLCDQCLMDRAAELAGTYEEESDVRS